LTAGTAEQALAVVQEREDVDLHSPTSGCSMITEPVCGLPKGHCQTGITVLYTTGQGVTDWMRCSPIRLAFCRSPIAPDDLDRLQKPAGAPAAPGRSRRVKGSRRVA
jgi:hypothetical protein